MFQKITAAGTVIHIVVHPGISGAYAELQIPAAGKDHLIAVGDAAAQQIALVAVGFQTAVVVGVVQMNAGEVLVEGLAEPVADFRLKGDTGDFPVVGQYMPGTVVERKTARKAVGKLDFAFHVRSKRQPGQAVGLDGITLGRGFLNIAQQGRQEEKQAEGLVLERIFCLSCCHWIRSIRSNTSPSISSILRNSGFRDRAF